MKIKQTLRRIYSIWDFVGIFAISLFCVFAFCDLTKLGFNLFFLNSLFQNSLMTSALWLGNKLLMEIYRERFNWDKSPFLRIAVSVTISVIYTLSTVYVFFYFVIIKEDFTTQSHQKDLRLTMVIAMIITLLVISIFEGIFLFKRYRRTVMKAEVLKRAEIRSQYEALKNQVNPHFLFNSFNTLMGLIDMDKELAKTYLSRISDVFRYVLKSNNRALIPLSEEMELVKKYFFLLEIRFNKNIFLDVEIASKDFEKLLAPLTLQILVENAVKHNAVSSLHPLRISIESKENGLKISNNIKEKSMIDYESTGLGLKNLQNRYLYLSKERLSIKNDGKSFEVFIPLMNV